jgi:hypothetical protein
VKYSKKEIEETRTALLGWIKPGMTVYTKLNHVSRSGMSHSITPYVIVENEPRYITYSVAILFGTKRDKYDGVRVDSCGMDMGFELVYSLSRILFPDGFGMMSLDTYGYRNRHVTPKSPEHAARLVASGVKFSGRNGDASGWDHDGGFALRQRWI